MSDQTAPRPRRRLRKVKFRVLIAGRANAGKTTILQRVCDTTESPETYRMVDGERTKVESKTSHAPLHIVLMGQQIQLIPTSDRGEHNITDELEFSNHEGYVFHDSSGLENGSTKELKTLQEFIGKRAEQKRLVKQLHVIWYCIPMDDHRPGLNVDPLHALQINKNVPVIAVFTKGDAFRRNMRMDLEDDEQAGDDLDRLTNQRWMNDPAAHCDELIRTTAEALDSSTVALMLLAVQTKNLELSVQRAVQKSLEVFNVEPPVLMKGWKFGACASQHISHHVDIPIKFGVHNQWRKYSICSKFLIAVVRYATITFINMQISADDALNEAYRQAPNVLPKLSEWIATSTAQADDIVAFINSVPCDGTLRQHIPVPSGSISSETVTFNLQTLRVIEFLMEIPPLKKVMKYNKPTVLSFGWNHQQHILSFHELKFHPWGAGCDPITGARWIGQEVVGRLVERELFVDEALGYRFVYAARMQIFWAIKQLGR
ncbi:hypothetical protein C8F04DRAFT_1364836 [Mycena alexandri]|uniref:G domain-containing protein n=1 Tax=Mycena alexandri TaxID=1745969 RepID=A0AAD6SP18_9AGAR|nr:hypothetical protein C8F04DRAFT_1364836 [Mycena alexandri]